MIVSRVKTRQNLLSVVIGGTLAVVPMIARPTTVISNIAYNASIGTSGLGNLYLPAGYTSDTPVALAIHGGGWSGGDRYSWSGVAEFLCNDLGFAVFNIEYRLTSVGQYWPCCGNDCIDAANYLLGESFEQQYGIRCRNVWPCGGSAGGHLALWTGLSLPPEKVGGIISISGIGDLIPDQAVNPSRYVAFFGHTPTEEELVAASPMTLVTSNSPPVFCSNATTDTVVPPDCSQHMVDACLAVGVFAEHYTYEQRDTGHSIWIPGSNPHKLFPDIEAAIAAFAWKLRGAGFVVGESDFYSELSATDDVFAARPLIDNTMRKTGAGTLTLQNPRMTRAEVEVLEGGVAVAVSDTFAAPDLSAALQAKAAFWVDANANADTNANGLVSCWHDVREVAMQAPYQYMMATNAEAARQPALVSDAGLGGKKYLDFGTWGAQDTNPNSRWLFWADAGGAAKTLDLRAVFIVFGSHNGNSSGGGITLIQNATSLSPAPTAPFAGSSSALWLSSANVLADDAVNYLDRAMRSGRNLQMFDKAYHMVETFPLQAAKANTFAKDRTYPGYSGGSRICEAMFFTTELTDAERLQVQDYLWHKWFGRRGESSVGAFRLSNASPLDFFVGTNGAQAAVSGNGAISKSGPGTLTLTNDVAHTFDGTLRLREGRLNTTGEPFLFELNEGGQTLDAHDGSIVRMDAASGEVVKTGDGELGVAFVATGVSKIAVAAGALRLAPPQGSAAVPVTEGAVSEESLEAFVPEVRATGAQGGTYQAYLNTTAHGWSFTQDVSVVGTGFHAGVALDDAGGLLTVPAPEGDAVVYLNRGKVETGFTLAASGIYRLEFYAGARVPYYNRHVTVAVDGEPVRTAITLAAEFWKNAVVLPFLGAGAHTLSFQGVGADNARVAYLDAIQIVPVTLCDEAPVLAVVQNPSFEAPVELFEASVVTNEPSGTGWTFSGLAGMGRIQALNPSTRMMPQAVPEGIGAAFVPITGSLRQTVTFPTSGVYRLTFATAARPGLVNHSFDVTLGGETVQTCVTTDTAFQRIGVLLPQVESGASVELAFVGTGLANTASLIDDIRIERVADGGTTYPSQSMAGRVPKNTLFDIAPGAKLVLDFTGQVTVGKVTYNGQAVTGLINGTTHSEFVEGGGSILSPSRRTWMAVE